MHLNSWVFPNNLNNLYTLLAACRIIIYFSFMCPNYECVIKQTATYYPYSCRCNWRQNKIFCHCFVQCKLNWLWLRHWNCPRHAYSSGTRVFSYENCRGLVRSNQGRRKIACCQACAEGLNPEISPHAGLQLKKAIHFYNQPVLCVRILEICALYYNCYRISRICKH